MGWAERVKRWFKRTPSKGTADHPQPRQVSQADEDEEIAELIAIDII